MEPGSNETPGEDFFEEEPSDNSGTRRRWPWAAALVALALAAVGGGVAVAGNMRPAERAPAAASAPAVTASTASAEATATPSPTASKSAPASVPSPTVTTAAPATSAPATPAPATVAWRTFTSADKKISFEYPATWRVTDTSGGAGAVNVDVANEAAVVVASLHYGPSGGIGGACQNPVPYTVLDVVEVNLPYQPSKGSVTPRFAFRALQEPGHVTASYGLTSTVAGQNGTSCMFYNVVNGPSESPLYSFADTFQVNSGSSAQEDPKRKGAKTFPTMDAARAYMQSPEYLNAKRMITSLKINAG